MRPPKHVVLTSKTVRGRIFQKVLHRFRVPRTTPREDLFPLRVFEDPAPEWIEVLARSVLEHTEHERDHGEATLERAILWCRMCPKPEERASLICQWGSEPTRGRAENQKYLTRLFSILNQAR